MSFELLTTVLVMPVAETVVIAPFSCLKDFISVFSLPASAFKLLNAALTADDVGTPLDRLSKVSSRFIVVPDMTP